MKMDQIERQKCYNQARIKMLECINQSLTHDVIKKIHHYVAPQEELEYRQELNAPSVNQCKFLAPMGIYCKNEMEKMLQWYSDTCPIMTAAKFHWAFVKIHPFNDGNGRTVRILISFILLKAGYNDNLCQALEQYFDIHDREYDDALDDGNPIYNTFNKPSDKWISYFKFCVNQITIPI